MTEGERHIFDTLNDKLDPGSLTVQDVSGMAYFALSENGQTHRSFKAVVESSIISRCRAKLSRE